MLCRQQRLFGCLGTFHQHCILAGARAHHKIRPPAGAPDPHRPRPPVRFRTHTRLRADPLHRRPRRCTSRNGIGANGGSGSVLDDTGLWTVVVATVVAAAVLAVVVVLLVRHWRRGKSAHWRRRTVRAFIAQYWTFRVMLHLTRVTA